MTADSITIIEGGFVAACDTARRTGAYDIVIRGDRILDICHSAASYKTLHPDAQVVSAEGKLVIPGFIDAFHQGGSFLMSRAMRGSAHQRAENEQKFRSDITALRTTSSKERLTSAFALGYFASLKAGITAIGEYGFDGGEIAVTAARDALKRCDMKGVICLHNHDQIEAATAQPAPHVRFALGLPSEEDLTVYTLQTTLRTAKEIGLPIWIHFGRTREGIDLLKRNFGKSGLRLLKEFRFFDHTVIISRIAVFERADLNVLSDSGRPIIVTPGAPLFSGEMEPLYSRLRERGIPFAAGSGIGIHDPFKAMRTLTASTDACKTPFESGTELLMTQTLFPAQALGIDEETGSLIPGKKADLAFVDISELRYQTYRDTTSADSDLREILLDASTQSVTDVMVNGEFFVRQKTLLTISEEDLIRDIALWKEKFWARAPEPELSTTMTLITTTEENADDEKEFEGQADEGFRIIRKESEVRTAEPQERKQTELSPNVRRVFGDDE